MRLDGSSSLAVRRAECCEVKRECMVEATETGCSVELSAGAGSPYGAGRIRKLQNSALAEALVPSSCLLERAAGGLYRIN